MKTNEIRVEINAPSSKVFEFTTEPKNTPKWLDSVKQESINTDQIGLGTIYTNEYGSLEVTDYEKNKFFELTDPNKGYICSYTYRETEGTTELIYFEYMEKGEDLEAPLNKESFNRLKELLENN